MIVQARQQSYTGQAANKLSLFFEIRSCVGYRKKGNEVSDLKQFRLLIPAFWQTGISLLQFGI